METSRCSSLILSGLIAAGTLVFTSCAGPTVKLATAEPIKVDIDVRLDVYQHEQKPSVKPTASPTPAPDPASKRRNRMADIQEFKNQRLVGEGHEGLLVLRTVPGGDYGDYVRDGVEAENTDRMELMKGLAESQKTSLPEIQAKQADQWRSRSFPGEWIETIQPDGNWIWVQKEKSP